MATPEEKLVIGRFGGSGLGPENGLGDVIVALPLDVSHRERLGIVRQLVDGYRDEVAPGATVKPELVSSDVDAWVATKGLRAANFLRTGKRQGEARPPKDERDAMRGPKPGPPTIEKRVTDPETGEVVYDPETHEPLTEIVPMNIVDDRKVPYAKHAGARPTPRQIQDAEIALAAHPSRKHPWSKNPNKHRR